MKIAIVGSMKFHGKFKDLKEKLENKGHEVIIPQPNSIYSKEDNPKKKSMEDFNDNLEKSDIILVANFDKDEKPNYIGINSIMEIGMAFNRNKKIYILNKIPEECKDELEAIDCITLSGDIDNLK